MKKNQLSKVLLGLAFLIFVTVGTSSTAFAGWENNHTTYTKDGKVLTGYQKIGKSHYYFAKSGSNKGVMVKDKWVKVNGTKLYFTKSGKQVVQNKYICLTFDDGPGPYTNDLVKTLKTYDSHATFFVQGCNAVRYTKTLKKIDAAGCQIGNHSYNHPNFSNISNAQIKSQLNRTSKIIKKATGSAPTVVRVPYGSTSSRIRSAIGAPYIYWSIDTLDWKTRSKSKTIAATMKGAKNGSIVLMHDIHKPSAQAAKALVPMLIKKGYKLVTIDEMAKIRGKNLKKGTVYYSFYKK